MQQAFNKVGNWNCLINFFLNPRTTHKVLPLPLLLGSGAGGCCWVFDVFEYVEKILPSVKSLSSPRKVEVYFIGGGAAGSL